MRGRIEGCAGVDTSPWSAVPYRRRSLGTCRARDGRPVWLRPGEHGQHVLHGCLHAGAGSSPQVHRSAAEATAAEAAVAEPVAEAASEEAEQA